MTKEQKNLNIIVAKLIWDIAKKSPDFGNAVMDVIGKKGYDNVIKLQKEQYKA